VKEFMHLGSKMDILAILGVQKYYFEVSSSALSYIRVKHEIVTLQ